MPKVKANTLTINYDQQGSGEPLVLIPYLAADHACYAYQVAEYAKHFTCYTLDPRGAGETDKPEGPYSMELFADDVAAFMDAVGLAKADVFGYSMGSAAGLQLAIRHPGKVNKLVAASVAYDAKGWQLAFTAMIPSMTPEMLAGTPMPAEYKKLAPNPDGFPELARKLIQLEKEPMAWEADVRKLKTPVLIIAGDADVATLEHSVKLFRLLGGGAMGDMGKPLAASRLAVLPATAHTAVITQPELLIAFIEPFLKGVTPKGMFEASAGK